MVPPGRRVNEIQLSSSLGISRPPLWEAFRILEQHHLVVSIPRKGPHVTQGSKEALQNGHQAREMIDCYAIDLLETKNIRDLPQVASALAKTSKFSTPSDADRRQLLTHHFTQTVSCYGSYCRCYDSRHRGYPLGLSSFRSSYITTEIKEQVALLPPYENPPMI
jgi:hypothetical protein